MKFFAQGTKITPNQLPFHGDHIDLISLTIDNKKMENMEKPYHTMPSSTETHAAWFEPSLHVPVT